MKVKTERLQQLQGLPLLFSLLIHLLVFFVIIHLVFKLSENTEKLHISRRLQGFVNQQSKTHVFDLQ